MPYDEDLQITPQSEGFTRHRQWDFEGTPADHYPLLLRYPYQLLYSSQVVKQADLVFALYMCSDCFSAEQRARDFEYYEAITVRDSSLSACVQAIMAAEVGHDELAYDYLAETAFIDLRDLAHNTHDGVHLAALAGCWLVAVAGFGGMRDHGDEARVRAPPARAARAAALPADLARVPAARHRRPRRGELRAARRRRARRRPSRRARWRSTAPGAAASRPIPAAPARPRPAQPPGREPPLGDAAR